VSSLRPGPASLPLTTYTRARPFAQVKPQAVLVMTHIEDTEVHRTFLRAGASEVLVKGVPFGEVLAAVRRLGADG
jgi:DNA-binding NarL/FixJ family response regulator